MVYGTRTDSELFLDCWEIIHEIALLSNRPETDHLTAIKLEMLHDLYQPKFAELWARIDDNS